MWLRFQDLPQKETKTSKKGAEKKDLQKQLTASKNAAAPADPVTSNQKPSLLQGSFVPTNQEPGSFTRTNQELGSFTRTNQEPGSFTQTNQEPGSYTRTNQEPGSFTPSNQATGSFIQTNPEKGSLTPTNQKPASQAPPTPMWQTSDNFRYNYTVCKSNSKRRFQGIMYIS